VSRVVAILIALALTGNVRATAQSPAITKKVLDNGATLVVKPEPGNGLVAICAMVKVGANQESIQNAGIGNFVTQLLLASTRPSSAEEVAAVADEVGGSIQARWSPDCAQIRCVTTTAMFNRAMSLIGEALTQANFEEKWVEQARKQLLKQLSSESDDLFTITYDNLRELLYEDNGYRRPQLGFKRTIKLATPQDLQKFYNAYYVPNNIVISIVGDVTVEQALDRVEKIFAGIPAGKLPKDRGVPDEKLDMPKQRASEAELGAAYLLVGWLAPGVLSKDYAAMAVAANALGGGKASMMFRELRQKRGMGYQIGTIYQRHRHQSHVVAYVITDPYKLELATMSSQIVLDDVKSALLEQVAKLRDSRLTDSELKRAKGYTIGTYALSHQRLLDRAFDLGWFEAVGPGYEFYNRFPEEVEKVTAEEVQHVARKYLTPNCAAVLLLPKTQSAPTDNSETPENSNKP